VIDITAMRASLSTCTGYGAVEVESYREDVGALLDALEAATAEAATMRAWAEEAAAAENANAEDARRERAAVVAWLRLRERQIEDWPPGGMNEISLTYNIIATSIERGEHRREEGA
jgi:hypothetical protein